MKLKMILVALLLFVVVMSLAFAARPALASNSLDKVIKPKVSSVTITNAWRENFLFVVVDINVVNNSKPCRGPVAIKAVKVTNFINAPKTTFKFYQTVTNPHCVDLTPQPHTDTFTQSVILLEGHTGSIVVNGVKVPIGPIP